MRHSAALLGLVALALGAPALPQSAAGEAHALQGASELDAVIAEYRELGRAPVQEALASGSPQPLEPYRRLLARAGAVDPASLSTAEAVDRAYLIGVLETDVRSTEARLERPEGEWAIGKELYDFVIQHRWFLDADADEIIARGRRAFEQIEAEAQRVAERIQPGAHWVQVYESLKDDHPPAGGIKDAYQAQMDAAREFVRANHIVTLPEGERVSTIDTPEEERRSSPYGTFDSVDPFGDGLEGFLVLTPIEEWMTPAQQAERLRAHHRSWIPIIAVHEAYPGHHVHALKVRENPRPLRRMAGESITSEGWGLFTEQLMWDLGFLRGDDVYLTVLRNRLWRAARVILDASLHTGRMSIEEAEAFLVERVRFDPYAAELEVAMYPRRPTYVLGYLIGMQEIAAIRDAWVARHGEPDPPSVLWDAFLTTGAIPPALVRAELLGEPVPAR